MPEDQLTMVAQLQAFGSLPDRLGKVEQSVHTLVHRMEQLEAERLPHRIANVEAVVSQVRGEVIEIKGITQEMSRQIQSGISDLRSAQDRQQSFIKGILWVGSFLMIVMNFAPTISVVIRSLVK